MIIKKREETVVIKTIKQNTSNELIEKKSKFIANLYYVETDKQAEEIINQTRKKYHDAKHNCYAYSIMTKKGIINKMSDDGEPSGTAGSPMLTILQKQELTNILVIVTRYFGGILLGTGGLVRAYSQAVLGAIQKAEIVSQENGYELEIEANYSEIEKIQYYCKKNNITIINIQYGEKIKLTLEVTECEKDKIFMLKKEGKLNIINYALLKEKNIRKNIEK